MDLKKYFIYPLVFLWAILEEFVYKTLVFPLVEKFKEYKFFEVFHDWIGNQNKYLVAFFFIIPFIGSEYVGIKAFVIFALGNIFLGLFLYGVKILLAIYSIFLFEANKVKLLEIYLINISYEYIMKVHKFIVGSSYYITMLNKAKEYSKWLKEKINY